MFSLHLDAVLEDVDLLCSLGYQQTRYMKMLVKCLGIGAYVLGILHYHMKKLAGDI